MQSIVELIGPGCGFAILPVHPGRCGGLPCLHVALDELIEDALRVSDLIRALAVAVAGERHVSRRGIDLDPFTADAHLEASLAVGELGDMAAHEAPAPSPAGRDFGVAPEHGDQLADRGVKDLAALVENIVEIDSDDAVVGEHEANAGHRAVCPARLGARGKV